MNHLERRGYVTSRDGTRIHELKINFLKPVWTTKLRAIGRIVKGGKTVGLLEYDITDEQHNLMARASSTCMTLRGEQGHGR